jgi:hypothetical protein
MIPGVDEKVFEQKGTKVTKKNEVGGCVHNEADRVRPLGPVTVVRVGYCCNSAPDAGNLGLRMGKTPLDTSLFGATMEDRAVPVIAIFLSQRTA